MINRKLFLLPLLLMVGLFAIPSYASAAIDPYSTVCKDSDVQDSAVCQDKSASDPSPVYGPNGILTKVANLLAVVGGIIAVVMIMVAGLKMVTSSGDSKKFSEARNTIIYAAVGIVVIVLARVIIEFILRLVS